jgi:hypothetical protein
VSPNWAKINRNNFGRLDWDINTHQEPQLKEEEEEEEEETILTGQIETSTRSTTQQRHTSPPPNHHELVATLHRHPPKNKAINMKSPSSLLAPSLPMISHTE